MKQPDYHTSITADVTAQPAMEKINRVSAWWGKDFEGSAQKLNDAFTIRFGETWVQFKVIETTADKRMVWQITDCFLHWLDDKTEWKNTKLVWELTAKKDSTQIDFTHAGLTPAVACYDDCKPGWDFYINESLLKLLKENKGRPNEG